MKYIAIEQNNTKQSLLRVKNQDSKNIWNRIILVVNAILNLHLNNAFLIT